MAVSIRLTRAAQQTTETGGVVSYSFSVTASLGVNIADEIFRMRQRPLDPSAIPPTTTSDFDGVCTPYDLTALPINEPIPPDDLYRLAVITVTYETELQGEEAWETIQADTQLLVDSQYANSLLVNESVVNFSS